MNKFMVTLSFPGIFSEDFITLIPRQRAMIVKLLSNGKLANFSLNEHRTSAWMVVNAKSLEDVERLLERFPMRDYFTATVEKLVLHDTAFMGMPKLVLN
jgi:muconolactone delta-isomerase